MSRELLILRHAKSDWDSEAPTDFERPLNGRGKRDAPRVGRWLLAQGWLPDHVVASPAQRARTTARRVAHEMGVDRDTIDWQQSVYLASVTTLRDVLGDCPVSAARVMLVGHNPGLEGLLAWLAGSGMTWPEDGKLLPTAAIARLAMPADWSRLEPGCADLLDLVRARDLPQA